MGHYTGLRAHVRVHERFRGLLASLHSDDESMDWAKSVDVNRDSFPDEADSIKRWCEFRRCGFIPFGMLSYMPDDFGCEIDKPDGGSVFSTETGSWEFACSLKNYKGEIEFFVANVLKVISEEIFYCESLYEEYPHFDRSKNMFEDQSTDWRDYTCKY